MHRRALLLLALRALLRLIDQAATGDVDLSMKYLSGLELF
uniref:Uncharacterized protein n=1 Tax=Arundo donax TaxID=35708 RepID=A0A0A9E5Y8_ARUDO